jgi:pimeloyl-ACP methyl ester carboxylesterase
VLSDEQRRVLVAIVRAYRTGARFLYLPPSEDELLFYYEGRDAPLLSGVTATAFDLEYLAREGLIWICRIEITSSGSIVESSTGPGILLDLTPQGLTMIEEQALWHETAGGDERSYVVTFIHGTWGRRSRWYSEGSKLRERLTARFGNRVHFNVVRWSGRNSHAARAAAITELRRSLDCLEGGTVNSRHFVITHSHGGNIAIYALREADIRTRLSGVICLNTPFMAVLRRNVSPLTTLVLFIAAAVGFIVLDSVTMYSINAFANALWLEELKDTWWVKACNTLAAFIARIGLIRLLNTAMTVHVPRMAGIMNRRFVEYREAARQEIVLPTVNMPVLCIRTAGEEVVGAVAAATYAANAPLTALHPRALLLLFTLLIVGHFTGFVPSLIPINDLTVGFTFTIWPKWAFDWQSQLYLYMISSVAYVLVIISLLLLIAVILNPILRMAPIGLGWKYFIGGLLLNVTFTYTPATSAQVEFVDLDTELFGALGLSHSKVYDHQKTADAIGEWMDTPYSRKGREAH